MTGNIYDKETGRVIGSWFREDSMTEENYDHVALDHDVKFDGPPCDLCGCGGEDYEIKPCACRECDQYTCDACRAKNEVFAELDVCSNECAVFVIAEMRADMQAEIEMLRMAGKEMAKALEFIGGITKDNCGCDDPRPIMQYAHALGTCQGRAQSMSWWVKKVAA